MYFLLGSKNYLLNKIYFLFYLLVFFSFFQEYNFSINLPYALSITLLNGDIFVIYKDGISIYDSSLSNEKKSIENFTLSEKIENDTSFHKITISRFHENDYGYIISTINDKIYIFDFEGQKLYNSSSKELLGKYYTLVPIKGDDQEIQYMIGFANGNTININFYTYYLNNKTNFIKSNQNNPLNSIENNALSCQLLSNSTDEDKIIVCFTATNPDKLLAFYFDVNFLTNISLTKNISYPKDSAGVKSIKTAASLDTKKAFVCYVDNEILPLFNLFCSK